MLQSCSHKAFKYFQTLQPAVCFNTYTYIFQAKSDPGFVIFELLNGQKEAERVIVWRWRIR